MDAEELDNEVGDVPVAKKPKLDHLLQSKLPASELEVPKMETDAKPALPDHVQLELPTKVSDGSQNLSDEIQTNCLASEEPNHESTPVKKHLSNKPGSDKPPIKKKKLKRKKKRKTKVVENGESTPAINEDLSAAAGAKRKGKAAHLRKNIKEILCLKSLIMQVLRGNILKHWRIYKICGI